MRIKRWIVKNYLDPHRVLREFCRELQTKSKIRVYRLPMPIPKVMDRVPGGKWLALIINHLICAKTWKGEVILVREFLTVPLFLCLPLLAATRGKIWFLVQHNLQRASVRKYEALMLRAMEKFGLNFVVYEDTVSWEKVVGPRSRPTSVVAIRMPLERKTDEAFEFGGLDYVGIVGNYRPEKDPEKALFALLDSTIDKSRLVLGTGDQNLLERWRGKIKTHETHSYAEYRACLRACKVVVLSYSEDSYFWRSSGVISDAICNGAFVICPDYPVLANQIRSPETVGEVFTSPSEIPLLAASLLKAEPNLSVFKKYLHARSPEVVARKLSLEISE